MSNEDKLSEMQKKESKPQIEVHPRAAPNCKLDVLAFGVTCGLLIGLGALGAGFFSLVLTWAWAKTNVALAIGDFYIAFKPSAYLSVMSGVFGLLNGFIGGCIFAWIYNVLAKFMAAVLGDGDSVGPH